MNILLLTDDMIIGGVARHVTDIANALSASGNSITVAATEGDARRWLSKEIEFVPLTLKNNKRMTNNYFGCIPSYRTLHALLKQKKYSLVHSHKRYSHLLGKIVTRQFNIPFITSYHTVFSNKRSLSFFGDKTICCTNAVRETLVRQFHRPLEELITVYNGINSFREYAQSEKEDVRRSLKIQMQQTVIGSVGQFVPEKDRKTLLLALKALTDKKNNADIVVVLLGYGPEKKRMEQLCRALKLEQIVRFVGEDISVEALCNISNFMVLNSITEGLPLVLLEAASVGKMHIATNVGGISDFIEDHRTGILISSKNPDELCDAIYALLQQPEHAVRLGIQAKEKYLRSFTFHGMFEQINDVYQNIILE